MPGQGAIEPWKASSDGFVMYRKSKCIIPYRILVTQRSTVGSSAAVRRVHDHKPVLKGRTQKNMVATQYNSEYNVR